MLRLVNYEELQAKLLVVSALIDSQSSGSVLFFQQVEQWLRDLEIILANNKAPEAGRIAALRGSLASAGMGVPSGSLASRSDLSRSKLKAAAALSAVQQATDIVSKYIEIDRERFREAERIVMQMIAVSRAKGLIDAFPAEESADALRFYWKKLSTESEVANGVVSVEGLVGPIDSLIILSRML